MANRVRNRGGASLTGNVVQGHRTMSSPARVKQFIGVGLPKSGRRSNGARPRKMYPRVTKDQKGTPMETFIMKNFRPLQDLYNSMNRGPGVLTSNEASGRLGTHWRNIKKAGTGSRAIGDFIKEHGGSVGAVKKILLGLHDVHFGAEPKKP